MKPVCKSEARWKFWRESNPNNSHLKGFTKWAKKMMNKARRRDGKYLCRETA
jgi:hypothetical protein